MFREHWHKKPFLVLKCSSYYLYFASLPLQTLTYSYFQSFYIQSYTNILSAAYFLSTRPREGRTVSFIKSLLTKFILQGKLSGLKFSRSMLLCGMFFQSFLLGSADSWKPKWYNNNNNKILCRTATKWQVAAQLKQKLLVVTNLCVPQCHRSHTHTTEFPGTLPQSSQVLGPCFTLRDCSGLLPQLFQKKESCEEFI